MSASEIREIPRAEYTAFLASVVHSVFQRLEWLELVEQLYPIRVITLGCFTADRLEVVIPMMRRRFGAATLLGAPLRRCPVPPATPFCAPAAKADLALQALAPWIERNSSGYAQVTIPSTTGVPKNVAAETSENLELWISRPLPELWQLLSKKTRYTVRRAVKDGVKLHWASSQGFAEIQAKLLGDTYGRQGAGVQSNYPLRLYRALLAMRRDTGLHVLYATFEGRVVAAAWLLVDAQRCHYWDAVTAGEGRHLNANHALVWCMIRWARRHGCETIDFVGTARGGRGGSRPGIGHFKRSMGAVPVEYHIVYWYSPAYRLALGLYRSWSSLRRRLVLPRRKVDDADS